MPETSGELGHEVQRLEDHLSRATNFAHYSGALKDLGGKWQVIYLKIQVD